MPDTQSEVPVAQRIRLVVLGLFLLGLLTQFYLAGRGVFGASNFNAHKDLGDSLHPVTLLIIILTLIARTTRNRVDIVLSVLLLVLFEVQFALADFDHPDVGAFHPVNALLLLGISAALFQRDL